MGTGTRVSASARVSVSALNILLRSLTSQICRLVP